MKTMDSTTPTSTVESSGEHGAPSRRLRSLVIVVAILLVGGGLAIAARASGSGNATLVASDTATTTTTALVTVPPTTEPYIPPTTEPPIAPVVSVPPATVPPRLPPTLRFAATSGSLHVDVEVTPGAGVTGDLLRFVTKVTDNEGGVFALGGTYGDDNRSFRPQLSLSCKEGAEPSSSPSSKEFVNEHAYRVAGVYRVEVIAVSGGCGRQERRVTAFESITIAPGPNLANGPQLVVPTAIPEPLSGRDPSLVYLTATAIDADGFVSRLVVDWGDGSAPSVLDFPLSDCHDPISTFPTSNVGETLTHDYATSGSHTVTITGTSSGCNGGDIQTASSEATVTAP